MQNKKINKKYKILIVDDSNEWLKSHLNMLHNMFNDYNCEIDTAMSAREGVNKVIASKTNYDLIITDLEMEAVFEFSLAGEWLLNTLLKKDIDRNSKYLIISGSYNISVIAEKFNVEYIPKDDLINNSLLLKYSVKELLKI